LVFAAAMGRRDVAQKPGFDGTLNLVFQPYAENLCGA